MRDLRKVLLTACVTVLALASLTGTAGASRGIQLSEAGGELSGIRATNAMLVFTVAEERIICSTSKILRIFREINKNPGNAIGQFREVTISGCRGATVRALAGSQPWNITYVSFAGTLPNITSLRLQINGMSFLIEWFFQRCLYSGNPQMTTVGSPINEMRLDETVTIPLFDQSLSTFFECPGTMTVSGSLRIAPNIRMRLF